MTVYHSASVAEITMCFDEYLLDLALDDDPDIHPLPLSADEQREILEGIRALDQLSRSLRKELPDVEGLCGPVVVR